MKEYKLLVLATLIAIFALYLITYSSSEEASNYENLTLDDKIFFFNDLDDEQKEGIATTSMDSLKVDFFPDSLVYNKIKSFDHQCTYRYLVLHHNLLLLPSN